MLFPEAQKAAQLNTTEYYRRQELSSIKKRLQQWEQDILFWLSTVQWAPDILKDWSYKANSCNLPMPQKIPK